MSSITGNKLNIFVLGGTGFIGNHLLRILSVKGVTVKVLSRDSKKVNPSNGNIRFVVGDLKQVDSLIEFFEPGSIVINLAYLSSKSKQENLEAIHNLALACGQVGVARLVHCSTAVVVGRSRDNVITEDTICQPLTEYEKTKLEIENILIDSLKGKTEVVIIRPTAVFGKNGKNLVKLANDFISQPAFITSLKTTLFYKRRLNLVCVENVVSAILFLMQINDRMDEERFIISDDDEKENNYYDIINLLANHFGHKPVKAFYLPYRYHILRMLLIASKRSNVNTHRNYSSNKLFSLGFKKSIQFSEGVRRFATWYQQSMFQN